MKQSQSKWLAFIVTRCEECEREKRRKGIRPFEVRGKRSEVLECED